MQKKYYQNSFLKVLKIFRKYFHFPKSKKSENFRFCCLEYFQFPENISQISIFQISISQISKRQNRKFSDFSILENENIFWFFSNLLKIKFDNFFLAYSRNLNLHHVIQSPAMNSAWPVTIFRLSEFQLQQIFTHNEWSFSRTSKSVKSREMQNFWRHTYDFFSDSSKSTTLSQLCALFVDEQNCWTRQQWFLLADSVTGCYSNI